MGTITGPFDLELYLVDSELGTSTLIEVNLGINGIVIFQDLCIGEYLVIVTDAFGCINEDLTTEILECSGISLNAPNQSYVTNSTDCSNPNGFISLLPGSAINSNGPFTHVWSDGTENLPGIDNLAPGTYSFTVTEENGCTESFSFNVGGEALNVFELVNPSCESTNNGSIEIAVLLSTNPQPVPPIDAYTYAWSNGGNTDIIAALAPGDYTVTITHIATGCSSIEIYNVAALASDGPLSLSVNTSDACFGNAIGSISTSVGGGVQPYSYIWSDEHRGANRNVLTPGTYCVTVTDYCGDQSNACFDINAIEVDIITTAQPGCRNEGGIQLTVSAGIPPLSFQWTNGASSQNISGLDDGTYIVVAFDARGCSTVRTQNLVNKDFETDMTESCAGLNNGSIEITLINPENDDVEIFIDGNVPFGINSMSQLIVEEWNDLSPNVDYNLSIEIGECVYDHTFMIDDEPTIKVLSIIDKDEEFCSYDEFCHGERIAEDSYQTNLVWDILGAAGSSGWLQSCEFDGFCNGQKVSTKSYSKKRIKGYEYLQILTAALQGGVIDGAYFDRLIEHFNFTGANPCTRFRYCPATLEIVSTGANWDNVNQIIQQGDCYIVDCNIDNYSFCVDEVLPDYFPQVNGSGGASLPNCNPRSYYISQIILWHDDMLNDFSSYPGSELFEFIQDVKLLESDPQSLTPSHCARVIFCLNDFSKLWDNYDDVNCNPFDFSCQPLPQSTNDFFYVRCIVPCPGTIGCEEFRKVYKEYPGLNLFGPGDDSNLRSKNNRLKQISNGNITQVINMNHDVTFDNLGFYVDSIYLVPKGLFSIENNSHYYDFSHRRNVYETRLSDKKIKYIYEEPDLEKLTFIESIEEDKSFQLNYFEGNSNWDKVITSDIFLNIDKMFKEENSTIICGKFQGNLSYDMTNIATNSGLGGFAITISEEGSILDLKVIENVAPTFLFKRRGSGIAGIGQSLTDWISINNNIISVNNGELFLTDLSNSVPNLIGLGIMSSAITIKEIAITSDGNNIAVGLVGPGTISLGKSFISLGSNEFVITEVNSTGQLNWYNKFNSTNIYSVSPKLVYNGSADLYLGFTLEGSVSNSLISMSSLGGQDVGLIKLNALNGSVTEQMQFGSTDDENLQEIFFDQGIIYFGGEFSGETESRILGNIEFENYSEPKGTVAYVSYLTEGSLTTKSQNEKHVQSNSRGTFEESSAKFKLAAFPNPFDNKVSISISSKKPLGQIRLNLYNSQNTLIDSKDIKTNNISEIFEHLFSDIPSGVYYLEGIDDENEREVIMITKI